LGRGAAIAAGVGLTASVCASTFTVINTSDSGSGSLFWAIEQANLNAGPDTILFTIPESDPGFDGTAWWIRPKIALPVLSDDGTAVLGGSQADAVGDKNPEGPEIALDGTDMPENSSCMSINSADNLVSGLVFTGSRSDGISIIGDYARRNRIVGNYFGTNPAGTESRTITGGISMQRGAKANRVGGSEPFEGNLISGCLGSGIYIYRSDSNVTVGNIIGLDRTGTKVLGNGANGITIGNARDNRVGGSLAGERNVISGNGSQGIDIGIFKATRNNTVQGNYIGTDKSGKFPLGNGSNGISVSNEASANRIGGTEPGESNLISGNTGFGIYIFTSGTDSNRIEGNRIGTDAAGDAPLPNGTGGICIFNGPKSNQVGPSNTIRHNFDSVFIQYDTTL
jgi:parallel beta-helix repeat protein